MMALVNVDEMKPLPPFLLINKDGAALPAFKAINKAAYWDRTACPYRKPKTAVDHGRNG
jgi:hypothetical protein